MRRRIFVTYIFSFLFLSYMSITRKSQSALEYMMTYGWAILIIVIVAGVLYSFGIFNPSSSASTTITGFSGLGVTQAACIQGGALQLQIGNALGYTVNITKLNTTGSSGQVVSIPTTIIISPSQSQSAFIPNATYELYSYKKETERKIYRLQKCAGA